MKTPNLLRRINPAAKPACGSRHQLTFKRLVALAMLAFGLTVADAATKYWGGAGVWTTASAWSLTSGGTLDQTWVANDDAVFDVANSTITGATTTFKSITANQNVTVTAGGTLDTAGTVATVTVASGMTLNTAGQALATTAGTGFIKSGAGTWISANGGAFPGGFVLNAGTIGIGGVNAMGVGALTINGGTISNSPGTTARALTGKYTSVTIGGDFAFEGAANLTFNSTNALGGVTRNITNNNTAASVVLNGPFVNGGLNLAGPGNWTIAPTFARTATATAGSSVITMADTTYLMVGQAISVTGASLTTGSVITSITPNTSITTSGTATNAVASAATTITGSAHSGGTTISGGLVRAGNDFAFGSGDITLNGGKLGTSTGVTITNNITLLADGDIANANNMTLSGVISGNQALTHSTTAALTLSGARHASAWRHQPARQRQARHG
ncbi:MAG: hypothetical protein NTZ16_08940 [Verrucomicrobia bacterium]|nr:hypothetical protein [Verrucomicrobiota bacterium]